jgi:uncharacterized protein
MYVHSTSAGAHLFSNPDRILEPPGLKTRRPRRLRCGGRVSTLSRRQGCRMQQILPQVLELLVCPLPECRAKLALQAAHLVCTGCGRRYRIEQNWPVLIPEEAEAPADRDA